MTNINLKDPLTILKNQIPVLGFVDVEKTINQTGSTEVITEEPKRELPGKTEVEVQDNKETEEINETEAISDQPLVLVYHTHTREAYIGKYKVDDVDRTLDPEYNVIRVGEELKKNWRNGVYLSYMTKQYMTYHMTILTDALMRELKIY
jgi:Stage II sporulation protein P (SpoIIP).